MKNKKPAILMADSCAGGLSILKYFQEWAGDFKIIYLADYEKNPFGLKGKSEINKIVRSWFKNIVKNNNIKLVVIACNTASIASYEILSDLSDEYSVPIVSMVDGVKHCFQRNSSHIFSKNVAIMATKYTIDSGKYTNIIKKYQPRKTVNIIATDSEHAVAIGNCNSESGKLLIKNELIKYGDAKIETLLLACTCFQLIVDQLREIYGNNTVFLDPAVDVSKLSKKVLNIAKNKPDPEIYIYTTSRSPESILSIHESSSLLSKKFVINNITLNR